MSDTFPAMGALALPATLSGSTTGASTETGEASETCGAPIGKTLWFRVVPGAAGVLTVDARGSDFDTVLGVFRGSSASSLQEEGCNDDWDDLQSFVEVVVSAGTTYHIQLGGYDGEAGSFQLSVSLDTSRTSVPTPSPSPTLFPTATPFPTSTPFRTATAAAARTATPMGAGQNATVLQASQSGQAGSSGTGAAGATASGMPVMRVTSSAVFSARSPSAALLVLPNGQEIEVAFDAQTIDMLRAVAPGVTSVRVSIDPAPVPLDPPMEGILGGGVVRPHARPVRLRIEAIDTLGAVMQLPAALEAGQALSGPAGGAHASGSEGVLGALSVWSSVDVAVSLPVMTQPAEAGRVFAWLRGVYAGGRFQGYVRPDARFDSATGTLRVRMPLADLQGAPEGTLFLPVVLQPAWVQSFVPELRIYSGPTDGAIDYGLAGPQFTIYTVVGPQVAGRIYVFNPTTLNYGWIDAAGVGPSGPPSGTPG